jgi:hypothetical protein
MYFQPADQLEEANQAPLFGHLPILVRETVKPAMLWASAPITSSMLAFPERRRETPTFV